MSFQAGLVKHYALQPGNGTRYDLLYVEYAHAWAKSGESAKARDMCAITWLRYEGVAGSSYVWEHGSTVYDYYAVEKCFINDADLAPILRDVERRFKSIKVRGFEDYDENGCWVGRIRNCPKSV